MIDKTKLKDYAHKLMFDMNDAEYETLQQEFEIILKQMDIIDQIDGIKDIEPMTFPFVTYQTHFRDDMMDNTISTNEVLLNAIDCENNRVHVPKVVE